MTNKPKITQKEMAEKIGISITAINLYLNHNILPKNKEKAAALIDFFKKRRKQSTTKITTKKQFFNNNKKEVNEMLTIAAQKKFNLTRTAFSDDVQKREDVFLSANQLYIREALYQTAKIGGLLALVGESGSGKTTLRRDLIERINHTADTITIIQPQSIDKTKLTASAICDAIIFDTSRERPFRTLEAKSRQVQKILTGSSRAGNSHCLIIEEAHDLSITTLKYLKRFWELEDGLKRLLSIIIVGQLELKEKLDVRQNYDARELIRRVEIAELMPLNNSISDYIQLKFTRANAKNPFDDSAYAAMLLRMQVSVTINEKLISMSYPLMTNKIVISALNLAAEIGVDTINSEVIESV